MATKVGLLLFSTALQTLATLPPNPTPPDDAQKKYRRNPFKILFGAPATMPYNLIMWSLTLFESSMILLPTDDATSPLARLTRSILGDRPINISNLSTIKPSLLVGCCLATLGFAMRLYSYRAMGYLFTFELAILPGHKLIKHGPYSVVRHPAYTGSLFITIASSLIYFGPDSLLYEICGLRLFWWAGIVCACAGFGFGKRAIVEDTVLCKEFGEEWKEWAGSVPWRIFPGIF